MKNLLSILFICSFLVACSNEPPPKYEKWGGTELTVYSESELDTYLNFDDSKGPISRGTTIYGYDVELNEFYKNKICVQKTGENGVYFPSQIENIFIVPNNGIMVDITLSEGIPEDMLTKHSNGVYEINVYEIVTEHGYSNFGQTIAKVSFDNKKEYDIVI